MIDDNPLWTTEQVGDFLGFPVSTVIRWRRVRKLWELAEGAADEKERMLYEERIVKIRGITLRGPPFIRIGARKIRYRKSDVLAWAEEPI